MSTLRTILALLFCIVFQASSFSQTELSHKPEQGAVLARLSYTSTYVVNGDEEKYLPSVCFELYRDGQYRIARRVTKGAPPRLGPREENRAGRLSQDQFETISKTLMQLDFRSSPEAVVVRKGLESFVAEIANGAEEKRLLWVNPDHQRPFPESAAKVIGWLADFQNSEDAMPFTVPQITTDPVCPRISQTPLQPANRRPSCH